VLVLADSASFHTGRYTDELKAQGCEVLVASLEEGACPHCQLKKHGPIRALHYPLAARQVKGIVREFGPDIINPHFVSGYGFLSAWGRLHRRRPVLSHLWGSDILVVPNKSAWHRWKTVRALSVSGGICADSEFLLKAAGELTGLPAKTRVIPWGIERRFLEPGKAKVPIERPLKIIVPRAHEQIYGNALIVRSLAPLVLAGDVDLTFPAFGSLYETFRANAATMVGDRITYYDPLPRDDFMRLMAAHDVYLSNAISDSSPASLIEAMGLGLIPIAADIPGVREWLSDDNGYLYEPYVGESLRNQVLALRSRTDQLEQIRQSNLERVKREAVFEDNIATTIEFMKSLIEDRAK
jgi:glycosyltransferase involved in cell wall biosynthesis